MAQAAGCGDLHQRAAQSSDATPVDAENSRARASSRSRADLDGDEHLLSIERDQVDLTASRRPAPPIDDLPSRRCQPSLRGRLGGQAQDVTRIGHRAMVPWSPYRPLIRP